MEWRFTKENISEVASQLWQQISGEKVFAFHGAMGAGKTTIIHALCDEKGVIDAVGSPTFSIINEYQYDCEGTWRPIFHIDLYRLTSEEEVIRAGVEDCLNSGYTCMVEWPEKAPGIFPDHTIHVYIEAINDRERILRFEG